MASPLTTHFKLSSSLSPKTVEDESYIAKFLYSGAVGSLMYAMVYNCEENSHVISVVSKYRANLGNAHCHAVK